MHLAQLAKSYQTTAINTATPGQLVLMLFDGALRFMATALHGFEIEAIGPRYEQIHTNLMKTQRILRELQCSLDLKAGGEFAKRMYALYDFMAEQLTEANMAKKPEPIRTVEGLLTEIRDAWSQMLQQTQQKVA